MPIIGFGIFYAFKKTKFRDMRELITFAYKEVEAVNRKIIYELVVLISAIFFVLPLSGCRTAAGIVIGVPLSGPFSYEEGPPPWAPAHGNRAKHMYRYYPYYGIYFEERTGAYFYMSNGEWHSSASLPVSVRIAVNDFVMLDMDSDRPYQYHNDVVKRYPSGQHKKKNHAQDEEDKKGKKREK